MKSFTIVDIPQRSQEWYSFRKGKIGASQVAAIMGLSPWTTKLQVWEEIAFGLTKPTNENMERGVRLEPEALEWANKKLGCSLKPIVIQSTIHPELIASLDGWGDGVLIEIKCPKKFSGSVPEHYIPQLQHQMYVADVDRCWYMEYVDGVGIFKKVDRDSDFIRKMLDNELAFLDSIMDFKPPEPTDKDWVEEVDPCQVSRAYRYKELSLLIDELDAERQDIRKDLLEWCDHERTRCGDLKIQKVVGRGRIDYEQIFKDYEQTLDREKYRKPPQETWRLYF